MIFRLDERLIFPDPALAEEDGLLAVGGDLSAGRLMLAYENGIFPWYSADEPILWYSPHERFVLFPDELVVSKSMRKVIRDGVFLVTLNKAFGSVIDSCSSITREGQDGTWITNEMKTAYAELHRLGFAHSVEVWKDNELVGGLYGVETGNVFCGESMFSKVSNASKTALIWLCQNTNFALIDCQVYTEHLESLGARMMPRQEYVDILHNNRIKT
ncbi:leucyl/phenylalanyl-tRNA--protein transferase [Mucilaginibacter achroorhodeus]|uniref:Leucyl/phenylalanyl-tRNA--protein transferase n=1 Tax=Mucilaginibacter achroorhodeus TaxID=2599294 RepID=A0A563TY30_9SPHI|nr:leucyl/phenylalanyl-tRNA--protein transferase [Mucilaginibacter achroorhodeus]TWR24236.1 leucyl/phenylalanyl-tRNA--protein transferase [Mucilaginibacter achroorhodeus]